jgi:predicted transcriptional regulator of viral defense system
VVTRRQLVAAGVSEAAVDVWLRRGRLFRLHRGAYALGHEAVGSRGRELAAVLAVGDDALLSHQSGSGLIGVRPQWRGPIHVLTTRRVKVTGVVVHYARSIDPRDRAEHHGIPVTAPARTLLDLAEVITERELEAALAEAAIKVLADRRALEDAIDRGNGRRGAAILAGLLDDVEPTRSALEREFRALVTAYELPSPILNGRVNGYEVDAHWPAQRLVVEIDGYAYHGNRKAFEDDRERDAELQACGWRVIRVTFRQLRRTPGAVAGRLRRTLELVG